MSYLFIIPCRSGSKRVKDKNIAPIGQFNLISLLIYKIAMAFPGSRIVVASDSVRYFQLAIKNLNSYKIDAEVSFYHRDIADSTDEATLELFLSVFLANYLQNSHKYDPNENIIVLQCTSPLLFVSTLRSALKLFSSSICSSLFSSISSHPFIWKSSSSPYCLPTFDQKEQRLSTSALPALHIETGAFYMFTLKSFLQDKVRSPNPTIPYPLSPIESLDIDHIKDLVIAQHVFSYLRPMILSCD